MSGSGWAASVWLRELLLDFLAQLTPFCSGRLVLPVLHGVSAKAGSSQENTSASCRFALRAMAR